MHRIFLSFVAGLLVSVSLYGEESMNLLEDAGFPEGFKIVTKVPGEGMEHPADAFVESSSADSQEITLHIPEGQDIWISSKAPLSLDPQSGYIFSVDLKWKDVQPVGPGVAPHGPGLFVYVYSVRGEHLLAIVPPLEALSDWTTLRIAFDTGKNDAFEHVRIQMITKDITGTVEIKNPRLIQTDPEKLPESPQFTLPDGSKVFGPKLAL